MDATTLVREAVDIEQLLEHYQFDHIEGDDYYIRCACKLHGGNNPTAFVVNRENSYWYCHTANCGGGDMFTLVQHMEGITFPQAVEWLANKYGISIDGLKVVEQTEQYMKEMKKFIKAMTSRIKKEVKSFTLPDTKPIKTYKDFKEETVKHFGLVYLPVINLVSKAGVPFQKYERLAFPIIQNGIQIGASLRATRENDSPKWLHVPTSFQTRNVLYNYDAIIPGEDVVVCEGMTDVWAYHEIGINAVCTFGAHLADEQYKQLIRLGSNVILSYDGDEAGQLATEKAKELLKHKCKVSVVHLEPHEDPASIERSELIGRYTSRRCCDS